MRPMSPEETKKVELGILKSFAEFCDSHGLRYYLAYGTLIGAVRHKGFIPWDDDIDVQMPRPDYDELLRIFNEENTGTDLKVISPYDKASVYSYAKLIDTRTVKIESGIKYDGREPLGIDIDIFPLDGQPDDDKAYSKWYNKKFRYYKLMTLVLSDPNLTWKRKLICPLLQLIRSKEYYQKKADKLSAPYKFDGCKFVGCTASAVNSKKNRHDKSLYEKTVELDFEGEKFKAPVGYHEILTAMYGDYMKLPPADKQVTHHSNLNFYKDGTENEKI